MAADDSTEAPRPARGPVEEVSVTCPRNVKGRAQERVSLANFAAYQATILLADVLDKGKGYISEENDQHLIRALLSRAHTLSEAVQTLLVDDEVPEAVEEAMREVLHG